MPDLTSTPSSGPPAAQSTRTHAPETVLYQGPGVRITDKKAIIAGTTIPLDAITAITLAHAPRRWSKTLWGLLFLGTLLSLMGGYFGRIEVLGPGVLLLLAVLVMSYRARQQYHLLLDRSDGRGDAFISSKGTRLEGLAKALHQAIVRRQEGGGKT